MGTERWLDTPERLRASAAPAGELRPTSRLWDAARIQKEWSRSRSAGQLTLTSPPLDFAGPHEIEEIRIRFSELGGLERFSLLWGDKPRLDARTELRNRRELTNLDRKQRAFRVRGDELAYVPLVRSEPGKDRLRHLMLRLPAATPEPALAEVALISKRDALAARPHGPVRHTLRGETRSAYHLAAPARLGYETRLGAAGVLHFGLLSLEPAAEVTWSLALASGNDERILQEGRITEAGRAWQDFQVPLPKVGDAPVTLTLSLSSDAPQDRLLVSNPTIVAPAQAAAHPNVVLYVIDSLRADRLGLSGYSKDTSPFLDSVAKAGVVFKNAYAQAAWTKPAVTSLLTSLHPQTHGVGARSSLDALPESVPTLQDLLRAHGYLTAQFTANAFAGQLSNLDQGFDWSLGPEAFEIRDAAAKREKPHSDDIHARLLPWLDAHAGARFFVYVHSIDPHPPCTAPRGARSLEGGDSESDLCDEEIRFNDDNLRALMGALGQRGLLKDTLLVVTADHGEAFGEHGHSGHGLSVREQELRIPLLLSQPGRLAPRVVETNAAALDVMPTVLRHCGVPFDAQALQGRDLLGTTAAPPVFAARFVYPDAPDLPEFHGREQLAVIDGRSKLVVRQRGRDAPVRELFDLKADPGERTDRSALDPERARRLERTLDEFLDRQRSARAAFLLSHGDAASAAAREPLPQDVLERLRALGYLK